MRVKERRSRNLIQTNVGIDSKIGNFYAKFHGILVILKFDQLLNLNIT